ncbi:hypothetical protein [Bacillus phage Anath]|uniref:Uncharacterized protein n=1 Tax=Bacillus phage Anath TaxID=2108114 RepID=A0A2P1JUL2_9CAUD|nr:hypothetical protein [Bacillus phage Anath]
MSKINLFEAYAKAYPNSLHTEKDVYFWIAWLCSEDYTVEQIFFALENADKIKLDLENLLEGLDGKQDYIANCQKILARMDSQGKETPLKYDSKNNVERINKQSWFGKGIARNLFE